MSISITKWSRSISEKSPQIVSVCSIPNCFLGISGERETIANAVDYYVVMLAMSVFPACVLELLGQRYVFFVQKFKVFTPKSPEGDFKWMKIR